MMGREMTWVGPAVVMRARRVAEWLDPSTGKVLSSQWAVLSVLERGAIGPTSPIRRIRSMRLMGRMRPMGRMAPRTEH